MLNNDIAYVKLSQFTDHCAKEVEDALQKLKEKNNIKGIVLDLRGNPGGLLNEAVNLTNLFVEKGTFVVSTKGKVEEWNKTFNAINNPFDTKIPLVVLVNSGSASASEIVSGALQDLDRGIIIGQRTFGKGLVQTTRNLSYGTQLKVTTAHYYTPSGRCIQAINYAERNEDGSVAKIPDSLKNTFKTSKGRTVSDGGGVEPDVITETNKPHQIVLSLLNKNLVFDFASEYYLKHKEIAPPGSFALTDKDFEDFVQFLKDKDYDYSTKTEDALKNFEKMAEKESYYSALKSDIDELRHKMMHDKEKDLIKYKTDIMRYLTEEIVSRYYFQSGRVENSLQNDPDIIKALELFNDPISFHKILNPSK
jgi:carboxyl-terminal processing protease